MPKISIITPAYNAQKYISRCIESVLNQTFIDFEHIIVNDGSKDETGKICDNFAFKDKRIKVIHKKNEGVSRARNDALKIATGEYILFADADDWLEEDMCKELIENAEKNKSDIVICEYNNFYENENRSEYIKLKQYANISFPEVITDDRNMYGGFSWNKLVKRDKVKCFFDRDIHYYENLLFFLENFNETTKYTVVFKPLYNYCINDGSAVHSKKFNTKKYLLWKH